MKTTELFTENQKEELDRLSEIEYALQESVFRCQLRFATLAKELFDGLHEPTAEIIVRDGNGSASETVHLRRVSVYNAAQTFADIQKKVNETAEIIERLKAESGERFRGL